ncbi:MAG: NAD(P) transhydrogenase subunit alpha [Planctomycetaceae bacterium]|nr:NAD(P) transhydrogenase subunit alpha [Planctomycetaceae bacterium]
MVDILVLVGVFLVTFLVGVVLILKVPPRLHTPLMSMTNAVSGITVLGGLLLFSGEVETSWCIQALGAIAIAAGAFNMLGGFAVTDRMLKLFKTRD